MRAAKYSYRLLFLLLFLLSSCAHSQRQKGSYSGSAGYRNLATVRQSINQCDCELANENCETSSAKDPAFQDRAAPKEFERSTPFRIDPAQVKKYEAFESKILGVPSNEQRALLALVRGTTEFQEYVKNLRLQSHSKELHYTPDELSLAYLNSFFNSLKGDSLMRYQDQALRENLLRHGAKPEDLRMDPQVSGRKLLQAVSASNRKRLIAKHPYVSKPEMRAAEDYVASLHFDFVHNGSGNPSLDLPILSSRQIERLGMRGGLNTKPFNKEALGSDGQVFFFIRTSSQNLSSSHIPSAYGREGVKITDRQYVSQNGWISPFIMTPSDLLSFAAAHAPKLLSSLEVVYERPRDAYADSYTVEELAAISKVLSRVHLFDFTLEDFEQVYKNELLLALDRRRIEFYDTFPDLLKFADAPGTPLPAILEAEIEKLSGVRFGFELKIPVAVPPTVLEIIAK